MLLLAVPPPALKRSFLLRGEGTRASYRRVKSWKHIALDGFIQRQGRAGAGSRARVQHLDEPPLLMNSLMLTRTARKPPNFSSCLAVASHAAFSTTVRFPPAVGGSTTTALQAKRFASSSETCPSSSTLFPFVRERGRVGREAACAPQHRRRPGTTARTSVSAGRTPCPGGRI